MAELAGNLWEWNLTKVVVVDVTDDYKLMLGPMPSEFYPVLEERYVPTLELDRQIRSHAWVDGYLYDWHETPSEDRGPWYVGVVDAALAAGAASSATPR